MKYILLFVLAICLVLWIERIYWKRVAHLLECRLLGEDRSQAATSLFDAWLDGRIESRLRKRQR